MAYDKKVTFTCNLTVQSKNHGVILSREVLTHHMKVILKQLVTCEKLKDTIDENYTFSTIKGEWKLTGLTSAQRTDNTY